MLSIKSFFALLLTCGVLYSCSKKSDTPAGGTTAISCTGITPGFAANVMPLIQANCATSTACHATGSINTGGPFTNYTQVKNKASIIRSQVVSKVMPQGGSLSAAQIQTIACWVDNGAPNN